MQTIRNALWFMQLSDRPKSNQTLGHQHLAAQAQQQQMKHNGMIMQHKVVTKQIFACTPSHFEG